MLLGKEPALRGKTTNNDDKRVARRIMSLRLCECVEMTRADAIAWTHGVTVNCQNTNLTATATARGHLYSSAINTLRLMECL